MKRIITIMALVTLALLVTTERAAGQSAWQQTAEPILTPQALTRFIESSGVDANVSEVMRALYATYREEYAALRQQVQSAFIPNTPDSAEMWLNGRLELAKSFEMSVATLLESRQAEAWKAFMATNRRTRILGELFSQTEMTRARVNLGRYLDMLEMTPADIEDTRTVMGEYYTRFDALLERFVAGMGRLLRDRHSRDNERREQSNDEFRRIRDETTELSAQFFRHLESSLRPELATRLRFLRDRDEFPVIFTESIVDHAMKILNEQPRGVDHAETAQAYDQYNQQRALLRQRLMAETRRYHEPEATRERTARRRALMEASNAGQIIDFDREMNTASEVVPEIHRLLNLERLTMTRLRTMIRFDELKPPVRIALRFYFEMLEIESE